MFKKKRQEEHYVLTVTEQYLETQVAISVNQKKTTPGESKATAEDADKLLLLIYKSMSDKSQPEKNEEKKNE